MAEELGSRDPTTTLSAMKQLRKLPFVLSMAETESLLETAQRLAADPSVGLYRQAGYARRTALFETLYASGMRIGEALPRSSDALLPLEPACRWCAARATTSRSCLSTTGRLRLFPSGRSWRLPIPVERLPLAVPFCSQRYEGFDASDHSLKSINPQ